MNKNVAEEKKPPLGRGGRDKEQPGSRAYFESIEIPGVCVTDVHSENGTVYIILVCEDWVDTETARHQYEMVCRAEIPVGMDLRVGAEKSRKG